MPERTTVVVRTDHLARGSDEWQEALNLMGRIPYATRRAYREAQMLCGMMHALKADVNNSGAASVMVSQASINAVCVMCESVRDKLSVTSQLVSSLMALLGQNEAWGLLNGVRYEIQPRDGPDE